MLYRIEPRACGDAAWSSLFIFHTALPTQIVYNIRDASWSRLWIALAGSAFGAPKMPPIRSEVLGVLTQILFATPRDVGRYYPPNPFAVQERPTPMLVDMTRHRPFEPTPVFGGEGLNVATS
jgi:hypothetical protein